MLTLREEIRINQAAQGVVPVAEAAAWFEALDSPRRLDALRGLVAVLLQAHPLPADVVTAIDLAPLKPTHTPAVLLSKGEFAEQASKLIALPVGEQLKSFGLLIALLGVADGRRRRTECANGCSHWWHRNLADELEVQRIVREHTE